MIANKEDTGGNHAANDSNAVDPAATSSISLLESTMISNPVISQYALQMQQQRLRCVL